MFIQAGPVFIEGNLEGITYINDREPWLPAKNYPQ